MVSAFTKCSSSQNLLFGPAMDSKWLLDILCTPAIQELECKIVDVYQSTDFRELDNYTYLLDRRKGLLDNELLKHQAELLPIIIDYNNAAIDALHVLWDKCMRKKQVFAQFMDDGEDFHFSSKLCFGSQYPKLHPLQSANRQVLWDALLDARLNYFAQSVTWELGYQHTKGEGDGWTHLNFGDFSGLKDGSDNWNEGLDRELTRDVHLGHVFHNPFDHSRLALTDYIFVRDFRIESEIIISQFITKDSS